MPTIDVDPTIAQEMLQFDGIRVSKVLLRDFWEHTGRFPAESLELLRESFPYRYFGLPPNDDSLERSSSLNPSIDNEFIEGYFRVLGEIAPKYVEFISQVSSELPPMSEQCNLSLLIPVRHESLRLGYTLREVLVREVGQELQLAQSGPDGYPIDPDRYEVVILGNRDESDPEPDDTLDIIDDFNRHFGHLGFHLFGASLSFPESVSGCGAARKVLQDIVLIRSIRRSRASHCLYLATADADILAFPRNSIDEYVQALDKNPAEPCGMADGRVVPSALDQVPLASLAHKIHVALYDVIHSDAFGPSANRFFHVTLNRRLLMGYMTVLRARSLIAVGGFPISSRASDLILDEQLAMYGGDFLKDRSVFSMLTRPHLRIPLQIVVSPRRMLMAHILRSNWYHDGTFTSVKHTRLTRESDDALARLAGEVPVEQGQQMVDRELQKQLSQLTRTAPSADRIVQDVCGAMARCGLSDGNYIVRGRGRSCSVSLSPSAYAVAEQLCRAVLK